MTALDEVMCLFCRAVVPVDVAVDAGWEPYFWYVDDHGERCVEAPTCPTCTAEHLEADPLDRGDGMQLKPDHGVALLMALGAAGGAS